MYMYFRFACICLLILSAERLCLSIEGSKKKEKISSPICVSPRREKSRRIREDKTPFDGKLSVKERLYVSRQTIGL